MWLLYLKLQFDVVCITGSDRSTFSVGQLTSRSSISICDRQEPSQGKSNAEDLFKWPGYQFRRGQHSQPVEGSIASYYKLYQVERAVWNDHHLEEHR